MITFLKIKNPKFKYILIFFSPIIVLIILLLIYSQNPNNYIILSIESDQFTSSKILNILSDLNNEVNKNNLKAYFTLETLKIKGKIFQKGSIVLYFNKENSEFISSFLKKYKIKDFFQISKIYFPVLEIKPVKIAVLDIGDTFYLYRSLNAMNFIYQKITSEDIRKNILETNKFNIIIIPPGISHHIAKTLGNDGGEKIKKFIEKGGNYIGICAGAYLLLSDSTHEIDSLKLLEIESINKNPWNIGMGILNIKLKDHPITLGFNIEKEIPVIYINGPILKKSKDSSNIASYLSLSSTKNFLNNLSDLSQLNQVIAEGTALVHIPFKKGNIVLFSFHPELHFIPGTSIKLPNSYNMRLLFNTIHFLANS